MRPGTKKRIGIFHRREASFSLETTHEVEEREETPPLGITRFRKARLLAIMDARKKKEKRGSRKQPKDRN